MKHEPTCERNIVLNLLQVILNSLHEFLLQIPNAISDSHHTEASFECSLHAEPIVKIQSFSEFLT